MFKAPGQLPPLSLLLDSLPTTDRAQVARFLDVSPRTIDRWEASEQAPRAAALALFWETRYGASFMDADAHRAATLAQGLADAYRREVQRLEILLSRALRLCESGPYGAANGPFWASGAQCWQEHPPGLFASR